LTPLIAPRPPPPPSTTSPPRPPPPPPPPPPRRNPPPSPTHLTVEISQNEYLPEGGDDVNAIVTVKSPDTGDAAPVADASSAEIIIIDCSGSMRSPQTKIAEARAATAAAVDVIRDGVAFAVVAGTEKAQPVFPHDGSLAVAD